MKGRAKWTTHTEAHNCVGGQLAALTQVQHPQREVAVGVQPFSEQIEEPLLWAMLSHSKQLAVQLTLSGTVWLHRSFPKSRVHLCRLLHRGQWLRGDLHANRAKLSLWNEAVPNQKFAY